MLNTPNNKYNFNFNSSSISLSNSKFKDIIFNNVSPYMLDFSYYNYLTSLKKGKVCVKSTTPNIKIKKEE